MICELCGKTFSNTYFRKHIKFQHPNVHTPKSNKCLENGCDSSFHFKSSLIEHLKDKHSIEIEKIQKSFASIDDFNGWLRRLETTKLSQYLRVSKKMTKDGKQILYYECNRSGKYKPTAVPRKRAVKFQGSNKINSVCTSHINVTIDEVKGSVHMVFWATHYGHEKELKHLRLNEKDRHKIVSKLNSGVPVNSILKSVRENVGPSLNRLNLLTRKDIINVKNSSKLNNTNQKKPENNINNIGTIEKRSDYVENISPDICLNEQGENNELLSNNNDICLIIMNSDFQEKTNKDSGDKIDCHSIKKDKDSAEDLFMQINTTLFSVLDKARQLKDLNDLQSLREVGQYLLAADGVASVCCRGIQSSNSAGLSDTLSDSWRKNSSCLDRTLINNKKRKKDCDI